LNSEGRIPNAETRTVVVEPPALGSVFGDFYVDEFFLRFFAEVVARIQPCRPSRKAGWSRQLLDDALWVNGGNCAATARMLRCGHNVVEAFKRGQFKERQKRAADVTPQQCRAAWVFHGNQVKAARTLGISPRAFANRITQWRQQQQTLTA